MPYFFDCYDAFPASQMALKYLEHSSAMDGRCIGGNLLFCIPRDMNHPISDNVNHNTLRNVYTYTS